MKNKFAAFAVIIVSTLALSGCLRDMQDQLRSEPLESSEFFADGRASRPRVEGTVAQGHLKEDDLLHTGKVDGKLAETFPMTVDEKMILRGKERYEIFCAACHGYTGEADGMVAQRGFPQPTSYHVDRLRESAPGYFFQVITNGFGKMASYADQVPAEDRWAIIAYIRALQYSQNVKAAELSSDKKSQLGVTYEQAAAQAKAGDGHGKKEEGHH